MTTQPPTDAARVAVSQEDRVRCAESMGRYWHAGMQQACVRGECDDMTIVQAFTRHRLAERERCAKHLEARADRVDPPGAKRVPMVDQHTASVLRANAAAIRETNDVG